MRLPVQVLSVSLASLALVGGVAGYAAAADGDERVRACADRQGRLSVLTGDACGAGETALSWGTRGPQGLPGQQGAPGVPGSQGVPGPAAATGPQGVPGLLSVKNARAAQTVPARSSVRLVVGCPGGRLALSADPVLQPGLVQTRLEPTEPASGYQLDVDNLTGLPLSARVTLVCAQVAPGALQPGYDEAAVQQVGAALPLPGVLATPTAAPSATAVPSAPLPQLPQSPWQGEGSLTWTAGVSADGRTFDLRARAGELVPGTDVSLTGRYAYRSGQVDQVGHTTRAGADGSAGTGHTGYCGTLSSLTYTFTQGDVVRTGTAKAPC